MVLFFFFFRCNQAKAQDQQALPQLKEARNAVQNAFIAVIEAERSGADVDGLLSALRSGADLLTQAELSNRIGDVNQALRKAESVLIIANEVTTGAIIARENGLVTRGNAIYLSIAVFLVAGLSYLAAVFLIWKRFRHNYAKRLLNSKPEMKTDET